MMLHLPRSKNYSAYTLLEMLIVLAIFVVLTSIGVSAFSSLNTTIALNEDLLTLKQNIRNAQRSAMLLERKNSERWIYGIGIDFSTVATDGKYKIFKWCSEYQEYGNSITRAPLPNYNNKQPVSIVNANLELNNPYIAKTCAYSGVISEIVRTEGVDPAISENLKIELSSNDAFGDVGGTPAYVLFESVSGRALFYDLNGRLVNFASDGTLIINPTDLTINISSIKFKNLKRIIKIGHISGKVYQS